MESQPKPRVIKLPGQRRRSLATTLLSRHPLHSSPLSSSSLPPETVSLKVVCISDTHNHQPELLPGDILIHAGDLTENGSFDELQEQLNWLSSQCHRHKIVIAGNHDVLLDEAFLEKYPERRYRDSRTLHDIDWGSATYLHDELITLDFSIHENNSDTPILPNKRRLIKIYGSTRTPQYGISAFQYPRDEDFWSDRIPPDTDILVVHGLPRFHLDARDFHRAGCQFLSREVAHVRPRLVVFGHIHASYGREDVVVDGVRSGYEEVLGNCGGWGMVLLMVVHVLWARVLRVAVGREGMLRRERVTAFVNASIVGGSGNEMRNQPVVVDL